MATPGKIYRNHLSSKLFIKPVTLVTLTGGDDTLDTINLETFGQLHSAAIVLRNMTLAGATTVTVYGGTTTSGGTLTTIATLTLASSDNEAVLEIAGEDVSAYAEVAGLMPEGFKSILFKINGANNDVIRGCVVVKPMHQKEGLTPSDVVVLT